MKRHISFLFLLFCIVTSVQAQTPRAGKVIRYVAKYGKYENDGLTWATAKRNVQDAINDLYSKGLQGEVWVAQGTYSPTESTESEGGSTLYMSFKVYPGITVRGGFYGLGEKGPVEGQTYTEIKSYHDADNGNALTHITVKSNGQEVTTTSVDTPMQYEGEVYAEDRMMKCHTVAGIPTDSSYMYETVLTGDLAQPAEFVWNDKRQVWEASFYGNCYHVVWFATNGFDSEGRAKALNIDRGTATVEGCVIQNGNARNTDLTSRYHTAYGGGAYMVKGSRLENCIVQNCEASRDGGGIYMDGGGVLSHCYIANCQALGIGVENGYGGGICIDTNYGSLNPSDNSNDRMGIYRSSVVGNVGRMGGGMAIKYDKTVTTTATQMLPEYLAFASAVLVANNTATTEGGGVYTKGGGAMTNMTIVRNRCNGTGVISDGIVTGRSGGLYCRDHALVLNTVLWGNACAVNNDVQYATSKSSSDVQSVDMQSCAVSQSDYTDWSATTSIYVRGIMNYNNGEHYTVATKGLQPTAAHAFPNFVLPSTKAGCYDGVDNGRVRNTNWVPSVNSTLANAGIVSHDLNPDGKYPFTETPYDILNKPYVSHATQGAYTREYSVMHATKVGDNEYHFYVDPNAPSYRPATDTEHGKSWDEPARYLANVLYCIKNQRGNLTAEQYANAKFVVHIKEGLIDNTESYSTERIRNVRMRLSSNTTLYGGYPAGLTGTDLKDEAKGLERNPVKYPTVLTGDLMDNYETNTSHMLVFDGVSHVLVDGVQIRYLNSRSRILDNDITEGAALNMQNCQGITIRNAVIADNTAENGAAAFVLNCKKVVFENCIFHNNDSRVIVSGEANDELMSTIVVKTDFNLSDWATSSSDYEVKFSHCNIMNNVGNALMLYNRGSVRIENSMMFGNTISPRSRVYYTEDTEDAKNGFGVYVAETVVRKADAGRTFAGALTVGDGVLYDEFTTIEGVTTTSTLRLRYLLNAPNLYPRFVNGIVNSGASPTGDVTFYGRATSFMPHNENPMTNGAVHTGAADTWGHDMSVVTPRTYGGLPDIGAIENYASTSTGDDENAYPGGQSENAAVYYVRTPDDGGDDNNSGLTWAKSFATITKAVETAAANATGTGEFNTVTLPASITRSTTPLASVSALAGVEYFQIRPSRPNNQLHNYEQCWWNVSGTGVNGLGDSEPNDNTPLSMSTLFTLEDATPTNARDSYYYIKSGTGSYVRTLRVSESPALGVTANKSEASSFLIDRGSSDGYSGFRFKTDASNNNYLNAYSATNIGWWVADIGCLWSAYEVEYVPAGEYEVEIKKYPDVYVAAGTYNEAVTMHEGIDIYGGFPTAGNPGMTERNISNTTEGYKTIIDGTGLTQRPLTQPEDFDAETMVEGFIIQNGTSSGAELGGGVKLMSNGVLKNCRVRNNTYDADANSPETCGGAGIYISSGALAKNCVIENNQAEGNGQRGKFVSGAGVFMDGGTFQNSLIVRNSAHNTGHNVLGAAIYIRLASQFYNCTIAYNVGSTDGNYPATGGVWDAYAKQISGTNYRDYSTFYNCIIWGNYAEGNGDENVFQIGMSGFYNGGGRCYDAMQNCYSSAASASFASDHDTDATKVRNFKTNGNYTLFLDSCRRYQPFTGTWETTDFSLRSDAVQCINMGANQSLLESMGITEDIVGNDRVIDCTVDKGAYEYNDSYSILPRTVQLANGGVDYTKAATFYVTPRGSGLASAADPGNAACAAKLQRVLDAAGRYKYQHPEQQVIVKVATYHDDDATDGEKPEFQYYATRTTDSDDMDVRVWSIIVPRGVEVWGGYSDFYNGDSDNGFYKFENGTVIDNRDVTQNQTRFDSYYYSTDQQTGVHTYHVLTFTDKVFDGEGKPYKRGDALTGSSTWQAGDTYMSMGTDGNVTARAVVDGIFITGGKANLTTTTTTTRNINSYGGAAIVTDYAHVRNCIVRDNEGIYGGALALTHNALVTGCLLDRNQADYGGAIYVFENGTSLSNGITVNTDNEGYDASSMEAETRYDYYMPRVMSSTIVNNGASVQGGGVWFKDNVRFMGVVVWQNRCQDQANVSGQYNVARNDGESYFTTEYCPFNYSVVQGIRPSGLNNNSVSADNEHGPRFYSEEYAASHTATNHVLGVIDKDATAPYQFLDFGYFNPSNYSVLTHGGIPLAIYEEYLSADEIAETDFMGISRDYSENKQRRFLEIGALVSKKSLEQKPLMLRLFVAKPENINVNAALAMAMTAETASPNTFDDYYSQEGSSFAYPFHSLQSALDYICRMRGRDISDSQDAAGDGRYFSAEAIRDSANNMPFEIWMGPGTYIPSVNLSNNYKNSVDNTFLIPEGVTIVGGHDPNYACDASGNDGTNGTASLPATRDDGKPIRHFIGAYSQPNYQPPSAGTLWADNQYYVDLNTKQIRLNTPDDEDAPTYHDIEYADTVYRIHHVQRYKANEKRKLFDVNANSVVEPWEFQNQTILSGQIEGAENRGVSHIVTILANQEYAGALPVTQGEHYFKYPTDPTDFHYGYTPHEQGQIIALDGLTFTGGYAYGYQQGTMGDESKLKYNHGGAILLDGNRYNNFHNHLGDADFKQTRYMHAEQMGSVGYRHIPLIVSQCKFENNQAGYGGAVSTNSTIDAVNCSFVHNRAMAGLDEDVDVKIKKYGSATDSIVHEFDVKYPGAGGAIYGTYQVTGINTIFENNEAVDPEMSTNSHTDEYTILTDMIYDMENTGSLDEENAGTTLYAGSGGAVFMASRGYFHFMNCDFVRNQAMAYPAIYTANPNYQAQMQKGSLTLKEYNQAFNTVFWGNEIHPNIVSSHQTNDKKRHLTVIGRVVNYGHADRGTLLANDRFTAETYDIDVDNTPASQADLDREVTDGTQRGYTEQIWFSAYEEGRGKSPKNNMDLRDFVFDPRKHVKAHLVAELKRKFMREDSSLGDAAAQTLADSAYQNCNILLDSQNGTSEGPNFVNPSQNAGYAGYVESADWSPARLGNLTDNGWGKVTQKVEADTSRTSYSTSLQVYDANNPLPDYPVGRTGTGGYSSETLGDYVVDGAYPAIRYMRGNEKYQMTVPIGMDEYMYTNYSTVQRPIYRISMDPNPSQDQTYIDIGVYEYNHTPLTYSTEADAVDVIWVSAKEKPDNGLPDGSAWSQPTSDMQRAIETLLSSRNGHRKEIRLMDGTITPIYTIEDKLAFYIDTYKQNNSASLDKDSTGRVMEGLGVKSLTIKGGYSHELPNVRSNELYPSYIRQQVRNDDTSDKWNYLFYIKDATQRYGVNGDYNETNGYGHLAGNDTTYRNVYTIPIEFDGVRLINDQASEGVQGSAIHYAPLDSVLAKADDYKKEGFIPTTEVKSTPANVTTSFDQSTSEDGDILYEHGFAVVQEPAKLIISKSHIMGSGKEGDASDNASAVYLGDNHGHGILYNNVFHSNHVTPLDALCRAVTVNNTYALNGGPVKLRGATSTLHNSVLWRNKATASGSQFVLEGVNYEGDESKQVRYDTTAVYLSHNSYTGGPGKSNDYASTTGLATVNFNTELTDDNADVMGGPNFKDYENGDITLRDFSFSPTLRLMNKGDNARYDTLRVADVTAEDALPLNADQSNMLYDLAINTTYYEDAASNPRFLGDIDLGAFEYQNQLRRVFYVDPFDDVAGTGTSWGNPIGRNGIQDAVNLAALYHANNAPEQAFVFVKGAPMRDKEDRHTGESITLQDGVSIYGSIDDNLVDTVAMKYIESKRAYYHTDDSILNFLLVLDEHDEGQVGPNTFRTAINGIYTNPTTRYNTDTAVLAGDALEEDFAKRGFYIRFPVYSLISGFHVTNKSAVLSPVIDVDPQVAVVGEKPKVAMRKIAVYDNTMADGVSADVKTLARVRNALVYNSLFRDNDAKGNRSVLRLDQDGYAVNVSVQGKTETTLDGGSTYISPYNGHGNPQDNPQAKLTEVEKTNRIIYSIVNYDRQDPLYASDTTLTMQTKYTMSGHNYRRSDRNMYFQLAEGSKHINEIPIRFTTDKPMGCEDILPQNLRWFVNYQRDRDMMGNPRVLTLLPTDTIAKAHGATAYASGMHLLDRGCFEAWFVNDEVVRTSTGAPVPAHHSPVTKHFAPHTGSVVYVNDNRNLVCGTELQPGFLLLKTGASLYGNGQNVKVSYLSVEREIDPKGSVVSLPFPMDYGEGIMEEGEYITGIARVHYHNAQGEYTDQAEKGGILHLQYDEDTEVYEYDPEDRMNPDYTFSAIDGAWLPLTDTKRDKNRGVLLVPPADVISKNSNIYKDADGDGVIDDDSPSRLIYAFTARGEEFDDMMYEEERDEKFKTVVLEQSDDTESTNHQLGGADTDPIPGADFTSKEDMGWNCIGMPYLVSDYRTFNEASADNVVPANAYAKKAESFKQHYNMHIPHTLWLYYNGTTTSDGETLVNGDGGFYSVPSWMDAKDDTDLSWHLPENDTPRLWVGEGIFVQTASVTGSESLRFYRPIYGLTASTGRRQANTRFFVDKDIDEQVAQLDVTVRHRTVYVRGLQGGEQIAIYDLPGRCYQMATVGEGRSEWTYVLPHSGIYVITVDGLSRKVVVD